MLSNEDKIEIEQMLAEHTEQLKQTFQQVTEKGDDLPNIAEIGDKVFYIKDGNLYISVEGKWNKVSTLTEV